MTTPALLINLSFLLSEPTGISVYASQVFPHLAALHPTLLTSQHYPNFQCYPVPADLTPAQGSKGHLKRLIWTQTQLPKIYRQLKAELLFSPVPEMPLFTGCRTVIMVHDLIPLRFPRVTSPLTQYFRWVLPRIVQEATHILCNSQATADDLMARFNLPAQKITPILLGYNQHHFYPRPDAENLSQNPYFLYLGRHDPHKNVGRLITAFAKFHRLNPCQNHELWLAGPGDRRYTPQLQQQAKELGIAPQVRWLDYVPYDQLPHLYSQALALVFPSLWEGFGFPVLEAIACGTPVITSQLSSLPEVAGEAALYVNPYEVEEITQAMQTLSQDTRLQQTLKQKGLARAQELTWEKTGQQTLKILQSLL